MALTVVQMSFADWWADVESPAQPTTSKGGNTVFFGYFDDTKNKPLKQKVEECLARYFDRYNMVATEVLVNDVQAQGLDVVADADGHSVPVHGKSHIPVNNIWCGCQEGE